MTVERYFVDRKKELRIFGRMVSGQEPRRILDICAGSGKGKSYLLRQMRTESRTEDVPCALAEFAPNWQPDPLKLMRELAERLGEKYFPDFCSRDAALHGQPPFSAPADETPSPGVSMEGEFKGARLRSIAGRDIRVVEQHRPPTAQEQERLVWELSRLFCRELTALAAERPAVLLFDAWEHVPAETSDWIDRWLLRPIRDGERGQLIVVLAGRPAGRRTCEPWGDWRGVVVRCKKLGAFAFDEVRCYYLEKRGLALEESHLQAYYQAVRHSPRLMGQIADELEGAQW